MRSRDIENSWWVDNVFITKKRIYLINSFFENNITYVCYIELEDFKSLTNKGSVIRHHVMCPPYIVNDTMTCGLSNTNMHINLTLNYQVVNIFEIGEEIFLQYLDNEIIKTISLSENENEDQNPLITLKKYEDKIVVQKNDKIYYLDLESNHLFFNDDNLINSIEIIKFIIYNDCLILLDKSNSLYIYKNKNLKLIKENTGKTNIFWINESNFLLTSLENNITHIYNIDTLKYSVFVESYLLFFSANDKFALLRTGDFNNNILNINNNLIMLD